MRYYFLFAETWSSCEGTSFLGIVDSMDYDMSGFTCSSFDTDHIYEYEVNFELRTNAKNVLSKVIPNELVKICLNYITCCDFVCKSHIAHYCPGIHKNKFDFSNKKKPEKIWPEDYPMFNIEVLYDECCSWCQMCSCFCDCEPRWHPSYQVDIRFEINENYDEKKYAVLLQLMSNELAYKTVLY
jgi:hypothetical protein